LACEDFSPSAELPGLESWLAAFVRAAVNLAGYQLEELYGRRLPEGRWQDRRTILATLVYLGFSPSELAPLFGITPASAREISRRGTLDRRYLLQVDRLLKAFSERYLGLHLPRLGPAPEACPRCGGKVLVDLDEWSCLYCGWRG
jgi:hypothetical protein